MTLKLNGVQDKRLKIIYSNVNNVITNLKKKKKNYSINPEYDLDAEESTSHLNFWPNSEFYVAPQIRYKHHAGGRGYGRGNGRRNHELPPHAFDLSDGYFYPDSSEEYSGEAYHSPHDHPHPPHHHHHRHPHGIPPGQLKKHGFPHGHPHGKYNIIGFCMNAFNTILLFRTPPTFSSASSL